MGQTNNKAARAPRPAPKPTYETTFVNFDLDKEQSAQCKAWKMDAAELWAAVMGFLDDGYSLSVQVDDRNACYMCIARAKIPGINTGLLLSGRGSTPDKAVKQVLFKHGLLDNDWTTVNGSGRTILDD